MGRPERVLSVFDAVAIIVGIVIGAGIFSMPSLVAGNAGSEWLVLVLWLLGGAISLIGALCYAELATAHPDPGGEYHFLTRAYGRDVGFMYAWARMTVIQTGSIATLAFVFGDYTQQLLPLGAYGASVYAALAVLVFTGINLIGIRETRSVQNVLFLVAIAGLVVMIAVGFSAPAPVGPQDAAAGNEEPIGFGALGLAMVFVLFTFGGWNEAAYISAEIKNGGTNIARALLIGIALITLLYLAVNFAFLQVLGIAGLAGSQAPGADLMRAATGEGGALLVTVLVMIVVLASINVTILTGARTNYALGRDFPLFRFLAHWSDGGGQPVRAILLQSAIALALVGLGAVSRDGVKTMVEYLSPVFWLFLLMTGIAVFVLRSREPDAERPFRVPFYPVTPVVFCLASAYLLYSSLSYTGIGALVGVIVLLIGLPFLMWARRLQPDVALGSRPAE